MKSAFFPVVPVPAPRQVIRDKFNPSMAVQRYRAYRDEIRLHATAQKFTMPENGYHMIFLMPMPDGWSAEKKAAHKKKPHQRRPDKDNLEKAFLDSVCADDSHIWDGRVSKIWYSRPGILVRW